MKMLTTAVIQNKINGLTSMYIVVFIIVTKVTKRNYKNCIKRLSQVSKTE